MIISISSYFIIQEILISNVKENLIEKESLIKNQIYKSGEIPNIHPIVEIKKSAESKVSEPGFREVSIWNPKENEQEQYIEYSDQISINNVIYSVRLRQSIFESEDLVLIITLWLSILLISVFILSYYITKKLNKTIWLNFEQNLLKIEKFSFNEPNPIELKNTGIDEFDRLNYVIDKLTEKLKSDYISLKEFSENASHEIQTPLSITMLNLEEILQQDLNEDLFKKVLTSINALKRLSTLNQSLILLTKIGNRQFIADKSVNFASLIKTKAEEFNLLFETKKIKLDINVEDDFTIKINEQLAEIMINNLMSNAIKHNIQNGKITIQVNKNEIRFCNSGNENSFTNETIFSRFTKGDTKSVGLGLAIVKNICNTNNLDIQYNKNELHCFIITKNM